MGSAKVYQLRPSVRMKSDEHEVLTARAEAAGLSLARYLVEAGLRDTAPSPEERRQRDQERTEREWLMTQLARVGNNLNQAVRRLHQQTGTITYTRLNQALDELTDVLGRVKADWTKSR